MKLRRVLTSRASRVSRSQEDVLETLRRDGIVVLPFLELIPDKGLWTELSEDVRKFVREAEPDAVQLANPETKEDYLVRRWRRPKGSPIETFAPTNPWIRLGVATELLNVINAYRGSTMRLVDFDNWYTIPYPRANRRVGSQEWHRDPWDNHIVKVFVYFTNVDEGAGPLEYIRSSPGGGRYGDLWPWQPGGIYPPQDEIPKKVAEKDLVVASGETGTMIICDTSGLHRGGFARTKSRVLSYHAYISRESPKKREFGVDWTSSTQVLPPEAMQTLK